jgi:MFS family permease
MSISYSIVNGLSRSLFGYLYDKFGISVLKVVAVVEIIVGASVYFTSGIAGLFFIFPVLAGLISAASVSIIPPSVSKVFGIENSAEVAGFVQITYGLTALLAPILSKGMNLSASETDSPYLILFEIGAGLGLVGLIILFTMKEDPFDYDLKSNKIIDEIKKEDEILNHPVFNPTDINVMVK